MTMTRPVLPSPRPLPDVVAQVEHRVVGPERPAAAGRRPAQPLPEPGHCADPLTQQPLRLRHAETWPRAQDQYGTDMHRHGPDVRGELHQVGRAGPVHPHPTMSFHIHPPNIHFDHRRLRRRGRADGMRGRGLRRDASAA
jgi:hypothetical protein